MSVWNYLSEAKGHACEFVSLGMDRESELPQLQQVIRAEQASVDGFINDNHHIILKVVQATPSKRLPLIRRVAKDLELEQLMLVLGGWQHCRKAVQAYIWMEENEFNFRGGMSYRMGTAIHGDFYSRIKAEPVSKWPFQWGQSPYKGERSRSEVYDVIDYDDIMDTFKP
jgi:hypothetical protein